MAAIIQHEDMPNLVSAVDCDSEGEINDSEYQVRWSRITEDHFRNSSLYKKVEVLMLGWPHTSGNLNITGEVDRLKNVFEDRFNYHVTVRYLEAEAVEDVQLEVNVIMGPWIKEHNTFDTLLIIYYAGHGKPGLAPGQLTLFEYV